MKCRQLVLVAAMAAVYAGNAAAVDGWAQNAQYAKSQSLQANYEKFSSSADIWVNPALIANYEGQITVDHTEMLGGGVKTGFGTIGLFLGRDHEGKITTADMTGVATGAFVTANAASAIPNTPINNLFDVFWADKLGGMNLGARLNYASRATKNTSLVNSKDYSARDINLAAGVDMPASKMDVGFTLGLPSVTAEDVFTLPAADSQKLTGDGLSWGIKGRVTLQEDAASAIRVAGHYSSEQYEATLEGPNGGTAIKKSKDNTSSSYGVTGNYELRKSGNRMIFSAGLVRTSGEDTLKQTTGAAVATNTVTKKTGLSIPLSAAYELNGLGEKKNWDLRGSVTKDVYSTGTSETVDTVTPSLSKTEGNNAMPVGFGIGLSYRPIEALNIDASMNQDYLFTGTNLVSNGTMQDLITRVTVTYKL
ncbi:MAG: hypothetical protein OEW58_10280 [Gammaproteobacteria bacterium]|nr:hypothetical protein [Gammaproteobacteria bacterium]